MNVLILAKQKLNVKKRFEKEALLNVVKIFFVCVVCCLDLNKNSKFTAILTFEAILNFSASRPINISFANPLNFLTLYLSLIAERFFEKGLVKKCHLDLKKKNP
jgi:hypothetical protein